MRFASRANDRRIRDLVVALDREGVPVAETWRRVGDAAWKLGLRRPGYHVVRELARSERARREARARTRRAVGGVLVAAASPRVVDLLIALDRLGLERTREELVLEQHKRSSGADDSDAEAWGSL